MRGTPPWSDDLTTGLRPELSSTKPPTDGSQRPQEGKDKQVSSESDPEGPIAAQMLSFVMDDPDFESDESDTQKRVVRTGCWLGSSGFILPEIEDSQRRSVSQSRV